MDQGNRCIASVALGILILTFAAFVPATTSAQTPVASPCAPSALLQVSSERVADLYAARPATGAEAGRLVELLASYGAAIEAGDADSLAALLTPTFASALGFLDCPDLLAAGSTTDQPAFLLTPLRVTTNDSGAWLAFIQRSYDDGSELGYRDVFMVIAEEQSDGSLRIVFAHRDVELTDGTFLSAEDIYLRGVSP